MKQLIVGIFAALLAATPAEAQHVRVDARVRLGPNVRIGVQSRPSYYRTHVYRPHTYRTSRRAPWYRRPYVRAVVVVPHRHNPHLVPRGHAHGQVRVHPRVERRHDRYYRDDRRGRDRRYR